MDCAAPLASSLSFSFSVGRVLADRIDSLDLGVERSLRCGMNGRLAVEDRYSASGCTQKDYAAEEKESFAFAGSWHGARYASTSTRSASGPCVCHPFPVTGSR
jgi:hypothetical protein